MPPFLDLACVRWFKKAKIVIISFVQIRVDFTLCDFGALRICLQSFALSG